MTQEQMLLLDILGVDTVLSVRDALNEAIGMYQRRIDDTNESDENGRKIIEFEREIIACRKKALEMFDV